MDQVGVGMHPEDVKASLRKRGTSLAAIAKEAGLHRSGPTAALRNPRYSKKAEMLIALALNVPPAAIWPDRWALDGTPLPRLPVKASDAGQPRKSSQKREAA